MSNTAKLVIPYLGHACMLLMMVMVASNTEMGSAQRELLSTLMWSISSVGVVTGIAFGVVYGLLVSGRNVDQLKQQVRNAKDALEDERRKYRRDL